jgi:hypothetical protein
MKTNQIKQTILVRNLMVVLYVERQSLNSFLFLIENFSKTEINRIQQKIGAKQYLK